MKQRRIIDNRKKQKFMMDDEFIDKMAKLCGWQGTIVYNSLCRHTDKNQQCFPSIKLIAEQHNVSRPTIIKGIEALKKRNVIDVSKIRSRGGKWLNNTYILLDKSGWDYGQVNLSATTIETIIPLDDETKSMLDILPSQCNLHSQLNNVDCKEIHGKETHKKETHLLQNENVLLDNDSSGKNLVTINNKDGEVEPTASSKLNEAIELFKLIVPGDFVGKRTAFAKPLVREAVGALLERYSIDELRNLIEKYNDKIEDPYRPSVGTVLEFCTTKLAKIEAFVKKTGGLWAQRSISTPEQSRIRDIQYQEVIDKVEQKTRLAKEKWEREHVH